ncbi:MAG: hypothetical protein FAF03_12360 [Epsilonproteobacteria bacterium]|nr:hypothetical protein [Campylobacterota bacterium]
MIENILIYSIGFILISILLLLIYLECFLIRKLYNEICVSKKNVKISSWFGYGKRLKCLKGFVTVEPYVKRVKQAILLHKANLWMGYFLIALVVVYKLLGYGNQPSSCVDKTDKVSITVTKIEGSSTNIKNYNSIEAIRNDKKLIKKEFQR